MEWWLIVFSLNITYDTKKITKLDTRPTKMVRSKLESRCVGDNFRMLVTVLVILVPNIHYLFT